MGRGDRTVGCKKSSEGQESKRNVKNDDSDEDYMLEEDAADDLSDELGSLVGESSDEESLDCFVDNDNEEEVQKITRSKVQTRNSKKRKGTYDDKNDEDYDDDVDDDADDDDADADDDDDDDEFSPEELDFSNEEDLPSPTGNSRVQARCSPKKKGSVKSQNRKTGSRRPQKKKRKGRSKSGKRKRMPTSKKKKPMSHYDSDFASSESSDHELTISEEEREQVREASDLSTRLTSNLRNSKKDQEHTSHYQLRKGKAKVEEKKTDVEKQVCGICFTEEGKITARGTLNCCSHFFCYACIIQWSKVESRCPICKQRFCTISKPASSATTSIDLRDEVIHIPERDQVYQPEPAPEEFMQYLQVYENLMCTECHEGGDDSLMLLCDICDSPAHTYCVGLGREVPEGNWYCEGCRPTAVDSTSLQAQNLMPIHSASNSAIIPEPSTFENMAEIDLNITIPEIPRNPVNGILESPRGPLVGGFQASSSSSVSSMGVSTDGRHGFRRLQYVLGRLRRDMDARMARSNLDT